ncbi:MAG: Lrp/AsnC family transcriptional regulator [Rhodobacteraceae bacterium]|nr:Lrp/AsnC family transcriptional regulator [Paracoccaceae bacterium]
MDKIDRNIARILQKDGRTPSAEIAEAVGTSVSTANERVRRLASTGKISATRAILEPTAMGAGLCAFILVDMDYTGESAAKAHLAQRPEVLELHHISGGHSYMVKVRVADTAAMQRFLQMELKPLKAVIHTETLIVLETAKETTEILISDPKE